jgi:hypothetical protein
MTYCSAEGPAGAVQSRRVVREGLQLEAVTVVGKRLLTQLQTDGLYTASSEALNGGPSSIDGYGDQGDSDSSGDGHLRAQGEAGLVRGVPRT